MNYPTDYPCATWQYNQGLGLNLGRTGFDSGWNRQRKAWPQLKTSLSLTFVMDTVMFDQWQGWMVANGDAWYTIPLDDYGAGAEATEVRNTSPISWAYAEHDTIIATVSAEVFIPDASVPVDPNPEYADAVNSLPSQPVTWVRGYKGIINDGTGVAASWSDYNGLPVNDNGLIGGLDTASSTLRESMQFDPIDDWFLTLTDPAVIQSGGQKPSSTDDTVLENGWANVFNVALYNSTVQCDGPFGIIPYGWPISWTLRGYNVYNLSTDPATPTVPPAEADYTVRDGNSGGALLFQELDVATTDGNSSAVTMPQRAGTDYIYLGAIYMQNTITCVYAFDTDAPFTNATSVYSAIGVTPKHGQIGVHELGSQSDHTVLAYFQFKLAHPLGVNIDAEQIIWAAGEVRLYVDKTGSIKFQPEDGVTNTVGTVLENDFAVVVIQQDVTSNPPQRIHRAYLNGIEAFEIDEGFWSTGVEPNLWTGGDWRGASAPVALANRRAMVAGFSEYTMFNYLLTDQEVLDLSNALLGP